MSELSQTTLAILAALGQYRYLTTAQMERLGVASSSSLSNTLKPLREIKRGALLKALDFGFLPTKGRLPLLYHLTPKGAETLQEAGSTATDPIHYRNSKLFPNDYYHRMTCVDLQIAMAQWTTQNGASIELVHTYYDPGKKVGNSGHQRTRLHWQTGHAIPDLIMMLKGEDNQKRLCLFELHNGKDAKRLVEQVKIHCDMIASQAAEFAYDYAHAARILLIFEEASTLVKFQKLTNGEHWLMNVDNRFYLKTVQDYQEDPFANWQGIDGEVKNLWKSA